MCSVYDSCHALCSFCGLRSYWAMVESLQYLILLYDLLMGLFLSLFLRFKCYLLLERAFFVMNISFFNRVLSFLSLYSVSLNCSGLFFRALGVRFVCSALDRFYSTACLFICRIKLLANGLHPLFSLCPIVSARVLYRSLFEFYYCAHITGHFSSRWSVGCKLLVGLSENSLIDPP